MSAGAAQAKRVTLAAIAGAHGITGEVRLKLFAESIDSLTQHKHFEAGGRALLLTKIRPDKAGAVARFQGVDDRNAAEALRGLTLDIDREALPTLADGEYYHADLLGLPCVSTTGEALGTVVAIENYGAGDVIEIERPDRRRFMVPMRPEAVPEWGEQLVVDAAFVE